MTMVLHGFGDRIFHVWHTYILQHQLTFFHSSNSLVKIEPTWLCPEELKAIINREREKREEKKKREKKLDIERETIQTL